MHAPCIIIYAPNVNVIKYSIIVYNDIHHSNNVRACVGGGGRQLNEALIFSTRITWLTVNGLRVTTIATGVYEPITVTLNASSNGGAPNMNIQALNFKQKSLDSFVKSTVPRVTKEAEVSLDRICSRIWFLFTKTTIFKEIVPIRFVSCTSCSELYAYRYKWRVKGCFGMRM